MTASAAVSVFRYPTLAGLLPGGQVMFTPSLTTRTGTGATGVAHGCWFSYVVMANPCRALGCWMADATRYNLLACVTRSPRAPSRMITISENWHPETDVALHHGDCRELLRRMPDASAQLIVTSPPYNLGKKYEKRVVLHEYLRREEEVIDACIDKLAPGGSICWQVGNHVDRGEVFPLDILLYSVFKKRGLSLRN